MELTFDFAKKTELCNEVYNNEGLLKMFSILLKESTIEIDVMRDIKNLLANSMKSEQTAIYRDMISNVTDKELYTMIEEFEGIAKDGKNLRQSPGSTLLFTIIYRVQKVLEVCNEKADIIVDELGNKTFINDIKEIIDNRSIFSKVLDLKTIKSQDNIIVQASDLLSGYINAVYNRDENVENDNEPKEINAIFNEYNIIMFKRFGQPPLDFSAYVQ